MPARPIHRFAAEDRHFRGARAAGLAGLAQGTAAIFGIVGYADSARSIRDASWALDEPPPSSLVDLGDAMSSPPATAMDINKRGGRPFLLAAGIEAALSVLNACPHDVAIVLSSTLPFLPAALGGTRLVCVGIHDLVPAGAVRAWRDKGALLVPATGTAAFDERLSAALLKVQTGSRAVLLFDVGVVDTGHAAGTASVNVGGLSALEVLGGIRQISRRLNVVAFSAIGLQAELDPRGHTELLVAAAVHSAAAAAAGI